MNRSAITLAAFLVATAGAFAAGSVDVRAEGPARIYLDGEYVGEAPLRLSGIAAGDHNIQAEDPTSGEVKTYFFHAPSGASVHKEILVGFGAGVTATPLGPPVVVPAQPTAVVQTVAAPAYCPPAWGRRRAYHRPARVAYTPVAAPVAYTSTQIVAQPAPVYAPRRRSNRERAKVHTRNTLLGLTAASQIFGGSKKTRVRSRNIGLGLTLLNEILR